MPFESCGEGDKPVQPMRMSDARMGGMDARDRTISSVLFTNGSLTVQRVVSHYTAPDWHPPFQVRGAGLVIPIDGSFRRRVNGVDQHVDRASGYFRHDGDEVSVAHPTGAPDTSTLLDVDLEAFGAIDPDDWPSGPIVLQPTVTLKHRFVLRAIRSHSDDLQIEMRVMDLLESVLGERLPAIRRHRPRRAQAELSAAVADELRRANGSFTLSELAHRVGCSTFHLSRTFRAATGMTLSRYRMNLRVNEVVHLLDQGADDLTRIAADCGFADHSHMTRSVVACLGDPPSRIRELLRRAS